MSIAVLLASLAAFVPLPSHFTVIQGACPQEGATWSCAMPDGTIYLVEPLGGSDTRLTLAHELGHVWDAEHMTDQYRAAFTSQTGSSGRPWFSEADTPFDPGEAFANAYAYCSMSPRARRREFRDDGGYPGIGINYQGRPGRQIVANTCWLLDHPPRY